MTTPTFDLTKIKDLRSTITLLKEHNKKSLIPTLNEMLKKEQKDFINRTTPGDDRHGLYVTAMNKKIKELKLQAKELDRKGQFKEIGEVRKDLDLFRERLRLSIFMHQVSSCSDY